MVHDYVDITQAERARLDLLDPYLTLEWSSVEKYKGTMFFSHRLHNGECLCIGHDLKPHSVIRAKNFEEALKIYTSRPSTACWD